MKPPLIFEYFDYYDCQLRKGRLDECVDLVRERKSMVSTPVIASVNCTYSHEWALLTRRLESAGAGALELPIFPRPTDFSRSSQETERAYFEVIKRVKSAVSIPTTLKISSYFTHLGPMIERLADTGVAGMVLFNRFWNPDIDIDKLQAIPTHVFSTPAEFTTSLWWIAIMADRVDFDLAASPVIHDGEAVIKQILAGAKAVQVVSALYRNRNHYILTMLDEVRGWMTTKGFEGLDQFRGKLSQARSTNPAAYERVQFIRYFAGRP